MREGVGECAGKSNVFSAEYGHSAGGQLVLVTKKGTNTWDGLGEEYAQNKNFNSIDQLTKNAIRGGTIPGQPDYDNNRFGGTIGGPILKNKLFVFGPYEYTTLLRAGTPNPLIPSIARALSPPRAIAPNSEVSNTVGN